MSLIACSHCDLIHDLQLAPGRATVRCVRCDAMLLRTRVDTVDRTIAWTLSALILFLVAICFPFLGINSSGLERHTSLLTGIFEIYGQGMVSVAILVALTCVLVPLMQMVGLLYVFLPLKFNRKAYAVETIFRLFRHIQPWNMMEVFMLGILVALVKLGDIATIVPGVAVFAFACLIFCLAFAVSSVDAHQVWTRIEGIAND